MPDNSNQPPAPSGPHGGDFEKYKLDVERIKFLRDEVKFEHMQISNRLTALITSQAFVFAGFAISAIAARREFKDYAWFSFGLLARFGMISSFLLLVAVGIGVVRLHKVRRKLLSDTDRELLLKYLPPWSETAHVLSLVYALALPVLCMCIWGKVLCQGSYLAGRADAANLQATPPAVAGSTVTLPNPSNAVQLNSKLVGDRTTN